MEKEKQQKEQSNLINSIQSPPINIQKHLQIASSRSVMMRRTNNVVLPDDIIYYDILTRIPAKYLVRFRMVCKSWKHNLSSPDFVKLHITRQQSVQDQDLLIGHKHWSRHRLVIISRSREIAVTVGPLRCEILLLGSINGLVCMASDSGTEFSLWNPATGQAKEINFPNHDCKECRHLLGFSWDHVADDYKVVIVCYVSRFSSKKHLYIYSCRSASWTRLTLPREVTPDKSMMEIFSFKIAPSTIVKGLPYWSYANNVLLGGTNSMRAYIDLFTKDELRSLPCLHLDYPTHRKFSLVNIKDCLLGMVYESDNRDGLVDMYSLDEESDSGVWSKMYTIGLVYIRNQAGLLSQCFKNGGEILIVRNDQLYFYDPKTKETKLIWSSHWVLRRSCYSYTPSLVCVQGMESMVVLPFQEMKLKKSAKKYNNLVVRRYDTSSGGSSPSSDSDSETSTSDSNA